MTVDHGYWAVLFLLSIPENRSDFMAARIVLAVRESQYIEPLLHYVHHSEYGEMLRITAFSRLDTFKEFMNGEDMPDAVIGDACFIEAWLVDGRSQLPWAVLSENGDYPAQGNANLAGGRMITKYQALPSLLESILQLCNLKRPKTAVHPGEETLLVGVISASGGSGKTTIAMNMAKQLGGQGLSVFYLNLECVDSSRLFLRTSPGNTPGLDRLLYELKAKAGDCDNKEGIVRSGVEKYMVRYEELRSHSFKPVENYNEILQMSMQDTLELLERLAENGRFDVVIVDTGSLEEERAKAVLQRCGMLLWVLRNDEVSMYKTTKWLEQCSNPLYGMPQEVPDKSRFVMNSVTEWAEGKTIEAMIRLDGELPCIPSWSLHNQVELCLNSPQFTAAVQQLCKGIIEPALPLLFTGKEPA